jgi:cobalt-zinc-cadmium efflux system protein
MPAPGSAHEHDHGHDHDHGCDGGLFHHHHHEVADYNRAFAIGTALNSLFVGIEAGYGWIAGSMALIADAGHNLSDVLGLLLAWGAHYLAQKPASERKTYGLRRITILASLTSAVLLLLALGAIGWEALQRLADPQPVAGMTVIVVAAIGVVINTATALLFVKGQHDLNIKGAYLHMAADAAVSLGVVIAGVAILYTGWRWLDPVLSLVIVTIVLIGTWHLLRDSLNLSIDGVPANIDLREIRDYLARQPGVEGIHDLHVWALSTTQTALTAHLITATPVGNRFLERIQNELRERFSIDHATIQVERADEESHCPLDREQCV